jgi:hypothetical protein
MASDAPLQTAAGALLVEPERPLHLPAAEDSDRITDASVHLERSDMCVVHIGIQVLEHVVELNAVRACGAERVGGSACLRVSGLKCEGAHEVRERQRGVVAGLMQPPLCRQQRRSIRGERLSPVQRVGSVVQLPQCYERVPQTDERVHVLRLHREDRSIHCLCMFGAAHQRMEPRNPDPGIDVVGVGRGERLKLLQRGFIAARPGQPFSLGALIRRLGKREQSNAQNGGGNEGHVGELSLASSPGPSTGPG